MAVGWNTPLNTLQICGFTTLWTALKADSNSMTPSVPQFQKKKFFLCYSSVSTPPLHPQNTRYSVHKVVHKAVKPQTCTVFRGAYQPRAIHSYGGFPEIIAGKPWSRESFDFVNSAVTNQQKADSRITFRPSVLHHRKYSQNVAGANGR